MKGLMVPVLLVSSMLALGCATQQKPYSLGKAFQSVPSTPADKGQVVFYYPQAHGMIHGYVSIIPISEDGEVVTGVTKRSYEVYNASPGEHEYFSGIGSWMHRLD